MKSSDDDEGPKKKSKKKNESSSSESDGAVFSEPLPHESTGNPILRGAEVAPGALFLEAARTAAQQTGARGRGSSETAAYAATGEQWMAYLRMVLMPRYDNKIPEEMMGELKTLATALEMFTKGEISELGDVLVQLLKSLEFDLDGNKAAAVAVQLVGMRDGGLTGYKELERAQRYQRNQLRLSQDAARLG